MLGVSITGVRFCSTSCVAPYVLVGGITTQRTQTEARKAAFYKFF